LTGLLRADDGRLPSQDHIEHHGAEALRVDADVELPRQENKPTVGVTVKMIDLLPIWFQVRKA
jgi:hypothetical protein